MQAIPRWRSVLNLKTSFIQSTAVTGTTTLSSLPSTHLASFHSTPISLEKWKNKWNNFDAGRGQQSSKSYVRYATRQKRADAKKALKDLLFNSGIPRFTFENEDRASGWDEFSDSEKKGPSKSFTHRFNRAHQRRRKRKVRRESFFFDNDFDVHPQTIFQATFGNEWYTWSFMPWGSPFQSSTAEFQWREGSSWNNCRNRGWETASDNESNDESPALGSSSDRMILGLPLRGPLKIEDVKTAFRSAALKWHPDKHQGPSQAMAEEKFKHCVNAYQSLCDALSSA